jgi:hypothetical protein
MKQAAGYPPEGWVQAHLRGPSLRLGTPNRLGTRCDVPPVWTQRTGCPGLRFFHQGQFEGRKKRISPHLVRAPLEPVNATLQQFYESLLAVLRQPTVRDGRWQLLEPPWGYHVFDVTGVA